MLTSSVQERADAGRQGAGATEFRKVSPNICESSARSSLYVMLMASRILRRFLDLKKKEVCICVSRIFAKFRCEHPKDNEFYIRTARECELDASGKLDNMATVPSIFPVMLGGGNTQTLSQNKKCLSTHNLLHTRCCSLDDCFKTSPNSNLRTAMTTHNTQLHFSQKYFQLGTHHLLATSRGRLDLPSGNHRQGRLQTPQ